MCTFAVCAVRTYLDSGWATSKLRSYTDPDLLGFSTIWRCRLGTRWAGESWPAYVASALMAVSVLALRHSVLAGASALVSLVLQVVVGAIVFAAAISVLAPHRFRVALEFASKASFRIRT